MKKTIIILFALSFTSLANADYLGSATISKLFGSSQIKFGVDNAPENSTCNFFSRHFIFDATTEKGKNMLSIILAAHMAGKKIDIWYTASTSSGSDQTNGCNPSTMAILTEVGFAI